MIVLSLGDDVSQKGSQQRRYACFSVVATSPLSPNPTNMPVPDVDVIPPQMIFTLDQLEIGKIIGSSGGTRVHRGVLLPRNMPVAIKHLWGKNAAVHCKREVAALQRLDHKHIVKVLGYCSAPCADEDEAYVLLELSEEGAINSAQSSTVTLTPHQRSLQALNWCSQVAEGLQYLHREHVLHLDVKPANILKFGDAVKLCDFGISKLIDGNSGATEATRRHTVAYAAPELLLGQFVSAETDLYGLGCLLCELMTGQRPWGAKGEAQIRSLAADGVTPDVEGLPWPPFCSEVISVLAKTLMSRDVADRGTIDSAITTLQQAITELRAPKVDAAQLLSSVSTLKPGWLQNVDERPTLLDALMCLVGVEAPSNRPDLVKHARNLARTSTVKSLLNDAYEVTSAGSDDDRAIVLYTVESPVCYMVNGVLSQVGCTEADLNIIAPFTKRLYCAIERLGRPYCGRGFRALYADAPPLSAAFENYSDHFARGSPVNLFQFLSFTMEPTSIEHITSSKRPIILLKCDGLIGFDIDDLSYQALTGAPREREVMVLPPAYFTVKAAPYKVNNFVHVDLVYHEGISRRGSFMAVMGEHPLLVDREGASSTLFLAAEFNDTTCIQALVDTGACDLRSQQLEGSSSMIIAALNNNVDAIHLLAGLGADVQTANGSTFTPLHVAAQRGHVDAIRTIVGHGAEVDAVTADGMTPLHVAIAAGFIDAVYALVELGADFRSVTRDGTTPLFIAAESGHGDIVTCLVDYETPLDGSAAAVVPKIRELVRAVTPSGTPLHAAASNNHVGVMELLVELGADVAAVSDLGDTPLHTASWHGHIDSIQMLVRHGADVDAKNVDGCTPLHYASRNGQMDAIRALAALGGSVVATTNAEESLLHVAALGGNVGVIKTLMDVGAVAAAKTARGDSVLHYAAKYGRVNIIHVLVNLGADVSAKSLVGDAPLHCAAINGHVGAIKALADFGASVSARTNDGDSPLHCAAMNGHVEAIRVLVGLGASVQATSVCDESPLHYAAAEGHVEAIQALIELGANVSATSEDHSTPLHEAALNGHDNAIKVLVERGANIGAKTNIGDSPLHAAAHSGHVSAVDALFELGASLSATSNDGGSPLHYAALQGHVVTMMELVRLGAHVAATSADGGTPLHWAAASGKSAAIIELIALGSDVSAESAEGMQPLHAAAMNGHTHAIKTLIELGADPSARSSSGLSPLFLAAEGGHVDAIKTLASLRADMTEDIDDETPAYAAASGGHLEALKALADLDADVTRDAIMKVAKSKGHHKIVEYINKERPATMTRQGSCVVQ
jgi:ankyrin repeat protein/serine/threonine protein kinase